MDAMARAGCIEIRYGVESGSDRVLGKVTKGFTAERSLEVLSEAVGMFPAVDAFYMWGLPREQHRRSRRRRRRGPRLARRQGRPLKKLQMLPVVVDVMSWS